MDEQIYKTADPTANIELLLSFMPHAQARFSEKKVRQYLDVLHGPYRISHDGSRIKAFDTTLETDPADAMVENEHGKNAYYMINEQPLTWTLFGPFVLEGIVSAVPGSGSKPIGFLDIGAGSAPYAVWAAKMFEFFQLEDLVVGIDVNPRALEFAKRNIEANGLQDRIELVCKWFEEAMYPKNSIKTAGIWPPYHPCGNEYHHLVPRHAEGGEDMQRVWRNQITECYPMLADDGVLIFNQQSPGGDTWHGPQAIAEIEELAPGASVIYADIYGPQSIVSFLDVIYPENDQKRYTNSMKAKYQTIHYLMGAIVKDGKGQRREFYHKLDGLPGWDQGEGNRVDCHKGIANLIRNLADKKEHKRLMAEK